MYSTNLCSKEEFRLTYIYTRTVISNIFHVGRDAVKLGKFVTEHQKSLLERSVADNCFPNKSTLKELALQTGLNERKIWSWFGRKRQTLRSRDGRSTHYITFMNMLIVESILIVNCNE